MDEEDAVFGSFLLVRRGTGTGTRTGTRTGTEEGTRTMAVAVEIEVEMVIETGIEMKGGITKGMVSIEIEAGNEMEVERRMLNLAWGGTVISQEQPTKAGDHSCMI